MSEWEKELRNKFCGKNCPAFEICDGDVHGGCEYLDDFIETVKREIKEALWELEYRQLNQDKGGEGCIHK